MTPDTIASSYWSNWRFLLCAIWISIVMVVSVIVIWKYEGSRNQDTERRDNRPDTVGSLYKDEAWRMSLKVAHPAWLLAYRLVAFCVLLAFLITDVVVDGGDVFINYTQWTFTMVIIYFGVSYPSMSLFYASVSFAMQVERVELLGPVNSSYELLKYFATSFSIYGCCGGGKNNGGYGANRAALDAEQGASVAPALEGNANLENRSESVRSTEVPQVRKPADIWGYVFQIIYQICAGALTLTDCVFWLLIYPFLSTKDYSLDFLSAGLHSLNAVFLLGDAILNSLQFPFFRVAYFVLWTAVFVIFQWIFHACYSSKWPYPFLDLASPYAPIWYVGVAVLHLPCYGIFALILRLKHYCCLSR